MSAYSSSPSTATLKPLLPSEDQTAQINAVFDFGIIPCLSAVGICGNVASMVLLARQGFRRSSNVLLFALALADVLYLAGINNFSRHVQDEYAPAGYKFSESVNYLFYIVYMMLLGAQYIGGYCSIVIPVLITGERLLVIFLPLKVHTIITPLRTLLVTSCVSFLIMVCFIYHYVLCFRFEQVIVSGALLGRVVPTERMYQDLGSGVYFLITDVLNYMTGVVPLVLVILGCVVIGVEIAVITRRRRQLTSGGPISNGRTLTKSSRTLLYICILYILCSSFGFMVVYVLRLPSVTNDNHLIFVLVSLATCSQCLNSVGNFIIYVAVNNNFSYTDLRVCSLVKNIRR